MLIFDPSKIIEGVANASGRSSMLIPAPSKIFVDPPKISSNAEIPAEGEAEAVLQVLMTHRGEAFFLPAALEPRRPIRVRGTSPMNTVRKLYESDLAAATPTLRWGGVELALG